MVFLHDPVEKVPLSLTGASIGFHSAHLSPQLSNMNPAVSSSCPGIVSGTHQAPTSGIDLYPGQTLDVSIHHEMKELGIHTLACEVSCIRHPPALVTSQSWQHQEPGPTPQPLVSTATDSSDHGNASPCPQQQHIFIQPGESL
ncbi:unnamed protein product [Protopolystoma xenopodis]|uniref:Trafficking protein particle complex subunit 13 N-terminal domain-containing protein n=1 Tax=Protopolystoma xenopodis TaxID=117903 RepID=A0A3S5FC99_9PLAT|nr:unnamed protein product [Protopolystoma xenopodis]